MKKICKHCKWWNLEKNTDVKILDRGYCKRQPPRIVIVQKEQTDDSLQKYLAFSILQRIWTITFDKDWCGEFTPKRKR